ncbi:MULTISPECIES: hypothetical protein [unclassified Nostoc]|uniref:hypothetical protein n=1 Tax=unclassified Nostoc TaxID=2593658 RepID=UPI002AD36E2B|nr:hypothetical protein [Nostoc sp. DedQUE03]MDZ7971583.1 hypothetical protein [Nostoc sp. DedQUE03]MDZ8046686.1 hypothetical protein [Nostoc sp. DedQUE02]
MKSFTPEVIRAVTPMFMATIGGVIAVTVLVSPKITEPSKWSAGLGFAGTAIAAAAGLAQNGKHEADFSVKKQGDNLQVETSASDPVDRH